MSKGRKRNPEEFDFNKFLQPAKEDIRGALGSILQKAPGPDKNEPHDNKREFHVTRVKTRSQRGDTQSFRHDEEALVLVIEVAASEAILQSGHRFHANFQVIDWASNAVKRDNWSRDLKFEWGPRFWLSEGNDWGPASEDYTTPAVLGLERGLYAFRALLEIPEMDILCHSSETLFRVW